MGTLRTLFALSVVFAHSPWRGGAMFVGAVNAVQLFYMISGFVITHVLMTVPRYGDVRTFYASRALRIYPVYYAVLILTFAWLVLAQRDFFAIYHALPMSVRIYLAVVNVTLFGEDSALFTTADASGLAFTSNFYAAPVALWKGLLVPQAWTLGLELCFYVLAPFVVRRLRLVVGLLVLSLVARAFAIAHGWGAQDPWTYRFFPFELALFLTGVVAYQVFLPAWRRFVPEALLDRVARIGTYALWLACIGFFLLPGSEGAKRIALFVVFAAGMPLAFLYQRRSRPDQLVGELSYPLYIGHYLMLWVCAAAFTALGIDSQTLRLSLYVLASFAFAWALHHWVVNRVERWRSRLRGKPREVEL